MRSHDPQQWFRTGYSYTAVGLFLDIVMKVGQSPLVTGVRAPGMSSSSFMSVSKEYCNLPF